jgi:tellurite methyltransferase
MKRYYWDNYYKKKKSPLKETFFAKFVYNKIKKLNLKIFDIGCGNGRDTIFFKKKGLDCVGLDKSTEILKKNKKNYKKYSNQFIKKNFCTFFKKKISTPFIVYSRFTWHSINYNDEKKLIRSLKGNKDLKYLFIETRTINDEIYGKGKKLGRHEFMTSHYRRFIDSKQLKKKLSKFLKIIYFKESKNLAKFKKENPCVARIIAMRR